MSFLAPLFLLGALAVAAPVIFHLIRRTTREQVPFSTLMFLKPSPPRLTRKSRIEHWLLLLLRAAVVLLLALAFARPFFRQAAAEAAPADTAAHRVFLLDTSASMRRGGLWDEARARLARELRAARPGDRVAVFTFDRAPMPVITFEEWAALPPGDPAALVAARLAGVSPSWAATRLDQALLRAAEELASLDSGGAAREIVLLSDVQEGGRLEALQAFDWPRGVTLRVEAVAAGPGGNAGLQVVADAADAARTAERAVRVRVVNSPDAQREQLQVVWAGADGRPAGAPVDVYVPPGQTRLVSLPVPTNGPAPDRVLLRGDAETFDNTAFALPPQPARTVVAYLGPDAADDTREPLFFLRRALTPTPRQELIVTNFSPGTPLPAAAALWVVTGPLASPAAAGLRTRLREGGTVLFMPRDASAAGTLAELLGLPAVSLGEAPAERFALLGELDFRHPLLAPFADPRYSDFSKIRFWRHRRLDAAALPEARVIARFDDGDPAWIEVPAGRGRLVVFTSGWHPADSQLALSSKFVPLLYALIERSGGGAPAAGSLVVGDPWPVPAGAGEATVTTPSGRAVALAAGAPAFTGTDEPGVYLFRAGARTERFVVNLDPAESRTAPLPLDAFEQAGIALAAARPPAAQTARQQALRLDAEQESRQQLWRGLVLAALALALAASALAGWTARRQPRESFA